MASLMEHTIDIDVLVEFKDMREAMSRRFKNDPNLRISYVANIAMLLHDHYGIKDYATRNAAANDLMHLIFES